MDHAVAYAILGVSGEATREEIRTAYRRRAFDTHPDRAAGSSAAFQAVAEAYRILSDVGARSAQDPASTTGPEASSRVPPTEAAKVLFEYLSDLASEMILNGATAAAVVSFLAREGCPESVARALEQDLRARVQSPASDSPPTAGPVDHGERQHADSSDSSPSRARTAAACASPTRATIATWSLVGVATAAVTAYALVAWLSDATPTSLDPRPQLVPPRAVAIAPPSPSAPAPAAPMRSSPARPRPQQGLPSRRPARGDEAEALRAMSTALDAERDALEADRNRLAADAAELKAERRRLDAAQAALGPASDPEQVSSLRRQEAAYDARLEAARRMETALQHRARDLNAKIMAYNNRLLSTR